MSSGSEGSREDVTILVVDDEPGVADFYSTYLREVGYTVWTAYNGRQALDIMEGEVDIVLLDRRMPEMSGDEVLSRLREHGYDCQIAMVTAVEPEFDVLEMGFDDYLVKPVSGEALEETVEHLLKRANYDSKMQEYFKLSSMVAVLEKSKTPEELEDNPEFQKLLKRAERKREELDQALDDLTEEDDFASAFQDIEDESNSTS
ncbi:MAG: response regulator [Halobacteria archaeon]|nr:response regulator [Halobacteria archaeon]